MPKSPPAVWPALLLTFAGAGFAPAGVRVADLRGKATWQRRGRRRDRHRDRHPHRDGRPHHAGFRSAGPPPPARPAPPRPHTPSRRPLR